MPEPASLDASLIVPFADPVPAERRTAAEERRRAALDDRKRSFLRMVSHELRTPLNAVIGFSEILSHELYGPLGAPQYREYAQIVHESGVKLLSQIQSFPAKRACTCFACSPAKMTISSSRGINRII